jgi:hypothetical protein
VAAAPPNNGLYTTKPPAVIGSIAVGTPFRDLAPQDIHYTAIGGLPTTVVVPETAFEKTKAMAATVYEGLKTVVEGLYSCSDMFLPLKAASGAFLKIIKTAEVSGPCTTRVHYSFIVCSCGPDCVG